MGKWENTTKEQALGILKRNYIDRRLVIEAINEGETINTVFALYRIKKGKYQRKQK